MVGLETDFASINISNSHVTHCKLRNQSQIHDKTEGSLLLPIPIGKNSHNEGTIPSATVSLKLHLAILESCQYITLSDAGQHSTWIRCYFHCQCNCFIHYFDDPVPYGAVIYAEDIPFQYNEQDIHTDFLGNPNGNIFLTANKDHDFFLLNHRGTALHISHISIKSSKSNHNYVLGQLLICKYHLQTQVAPYTLPTMQEKETPSSISKSNQKDALRNTIYNINSVDHHPQICMDASKPGGYMKL